MNKHYKVLLNKSSYVEWNIASARKELKVYDDKYKEFKAKKGVLTEKECGEYWFVKHERKEYAKKLHQLKNEKKQTAKAITTFQKEHVNGSFICYPFVKECRAIKYDGTNKEDVFKFSHSTQYYIQNEDRLYIIGKTDYIIDVGQYLVGTDKGYEVLSEEDFHNKYELEFPFCKRSDEC